MSEERALTKGQIIEYVAGRLGIKKVEARMFLDDLAAYAAQEVRRSGQFSLPGFGKLVLSHRKARIGRNPQTGEPIEIKARTTVKFRLAKSIKDAVLPDQG